MFLYKDLTKRCKPPKGQGAFSHYFLPKSFKLIMNMKKTKKTSQKPLGGKLKIMTKANFSYASPSKENEKKLTNITYLSKKKISLSELREQIDSLDAEILSLLSKRFELVKKIGQRKKAEKKEIFDPKREKDLLKNLSQKAQIKKISSQFIEELFKLILKQSRLLQK